MDVAGQGKIPDKLNVKLRNDGKVNRTTPRVNIINFQPLFTWKIKTMPTKVPDIGPHGGAISLNSDNSNKNNLNPDGTVDRINKQYQSIFIQGVGHGAGCIIPQNTGPVLIGTISLSPNSDLALWIIVGILLLILAIIWAITHLIYPVRQSKKSSVESNGRKNRFLKYNRHNWINSFKGRNKTHSDTIDQLSMIQLKTEVQNSQTVKSAIENKNQTKQLPYSTSINKDYAQSLRLSTHGSIRPSGLRSHSSTSLWSYQTTIADSSSLMHGSFSGPSMYSQIIELQGRGLIFTMSESKCPNTWLRMNCSSISYCEESPFEECLEVFLMFNETLLIGKMKNVRHKRNEGDFVIQIWKIDDGSLGKCVPNKWDSSNMTCDAVCTVHDKFLVLMHQGEIIVWNIAINLIVSSIKLPNIQTWKGKHSIQATQNMCDIIIMIFLPLSGATHLYTYNLDHLINGSSSFQYRSFSSQNTFYSLISDTSILIAGSTNSEIIIWNFLNNTEDLLNKNDREQIHRVLNSPSGDLILIQSNNGISIWKTKQWSKLSEIYMPSTKVCSMTFSQMMGSICLLAAALEDGSIHIYNTANGELLKILKINIPIVYMLFGRDNISLIVMSDRASHYLLFIFDIQ